MSRSIVFLHELNDRNLFFREGFGLFLSDYLLEDLYNGERVNVTAFSSSSVIVPDTFCSRALCNCLRPDSYSLDRENYLVYRTPYPFGSYKELSSLALIGEYLSEVIDSSQLFSIVGPYIQWLVGTEDDALRYNPHILFDACFYPTADSGAHDSLIDDYDEFKNVGELGFAAVAFYYAKNIAVRNALHFPSYKLHSFEFVDSLISDINSSFYSQTATPKDVGAIFPLYCKVRISSILSENSDKISFNEEHAKKALLAEEYAVLQEYNKHKSGSIELIGRLCVLQEGFIDRFREEYNLSDIEKPVEKYITWQYVISNYAKLDAKCASDYGRRYVRLAMYIKAMEECAIMHYSIRRNSQARSFYQELSELIGWNVLQKSLEPQINHFLEIDDNKAIYEGYVLPIIRKLKTDTSKHS